MIYTLYETTNKINGKIYVGIHKTNFLDDEYLGSGKLISAAIVKYGKENFQKRILQIFNNLEDARNAEAEIVTEEFVKDNSNYNLALGGGLGGKDINGLTFEGRSHTKETKERIGLRLRSKPRKLSDEGRLSISKSSKENELRKKKISDAFKGKPKTEEHKRNLSIAGKNSIVQRGGSFNKGIPKAKIKCPHCLKVGSPNNMSRWHFDNCKFLGSSSAVE